MSRDALLAALYDLCVDTDALDRWPEVERETFVYFERHAPPLTKMEALWLRRRLADVAR